MYSDEQHEVNYKKIAFYVLILVWAAVGLIGFSSSISSVITEAIGAVGVYG